VTVLDLTGEFCTVGQALTKSLGLDGLVNFRQGSALDIPYEAASFDIVWSQNVFMNIEDKAALFMGIERVLRSGGRLGFQDAVAGDFQPLHYPVNWATTAALSHLVPPEILRRTAAAAGLTEVVWEDVTPSVLQAAARQEASPPSSATQPRLPLLAYLIHAQEDADLRRANGLRNLREARLRWVQAVFEKTL
jgi:ubiquinone/menaquinone biosynthesis C-methylase UbiE